MKYATFLEAAEDYLRYRRKLGFALSNEGKELCRFARYADKIGHKGPITIELALQWAKLPQRCHSLYWACRLDIVRRFAKHMKISIPETEIPPEGILGSLYRRATPHIYSAQEISALMISAGNLNPLNGLRPHTYSTLFGLLASTGMRISEALRLSTYDVNLSSGIITIVKTKYKKSRIIPVHLTVIKAIESYINKKSIRHPKQNIDAFFITERGTSLKYRKVYRTFRGIIFKLGWRSKVRNRGPRIHDLRHTFAVRKFLEWYRNGEDVHKIMPYLATYSYPFRVK